MRQIFWTMDKGFPEDAIFHSRDGKDRRGKRRKDIIFLEKTWTFCNKDAFGDFLYVLFCGRRNKGVDFSCSKEL